MGIMKMYVCRCGAEFSTQQAVDIHRANDCPATEKKTNHDPVHSPDHYTAGGIETIDYLAAKMTPEQMEGFLVGNVLKYVSRYPRKNGLQDLEKAEWYLSRLIEQYKRFKIEN